MIDALSEEVATLREENQRLAREHFRPASAAKTAAEIRKVAAVLDEHPARGDDDGADSAVAIALETEMIRRGLVEVCELLQTMASQLAASLTNGVPLHEIDRRLRDRPVERDRRRRDGLSHGVAAGAMLTNGNGHREISLTDTHPEVAVASANGNGHHEISRTENHPEVAVASSRGVERNRQVPGEGGEPPLRIVKGIPGGSEWESPRSAVYDRVARAEAVVSEPIAVGEDARPTETPNTNGRAGYYDRVQRTDGNATR
ncbi:MAG TPA: hypothetical protein VK771_07030 [Acidimicrobiia bacterium]|nr:hypothetical protein [Acidimicrobiia bacterium]